MTQQVSDIHPLKRNGTTQGERFPASLQEQYVRLEERNLLDYLRQTAEYSKYVHFFQDNDVSSNSTWQSFFEEIYDFAAGKCKISSLDELSASGATSPHMALLLAFLQLLQLTNNNLNELTERHLLFFYEKVLQLKRKAAQPGQAIVFAELTQGTAEVLVESGRRFKAGKNAAGQDIYFKVKSDTIVNQAVVSDIKNICFGAGKITRRRKSDTLDGISQPLTDNPKSWYAFGKDTDEAAAIGFACSSPLLLLEEGERVITINTGTAASLTDFDIYITTKKGFTIISNVSGNNLTLDTAFPPVANADPKVHEGDYPVQHPVLKFVLKQSARNRYTDSWLAVVNINFTITVNGVRNLRLRNELGQIDVTKPFNPFGVLPQKGISELLIGYPGIVNKYTRNRITLHNTGGNFQTKYLLHKTWADSMDTASATLDNGFDETFAITTQSNYIKLIYNDTTVTSANTVDITYNSDKTIQSLKVNEAKAPLWKDITLDYTQSFSSKDNAEVVQLFHIHPFGVAPVAAFDSLLPQYEEESYLLIGIEGLHAGQSLSVHFQLQEDSGDPDQALPAVKWYVWVQNQLQPLAGAEIVQNTTLGLSQSGIIRFALKGKDYWSNSVLPGGMLWLTAACDKNHEALPRFISIRAQAIATAFDGDEDMELPAAAIAKFEVPVNGIKKIEQPFPSFGGHTPEMATGFKTRVSEHLRHKGYAISIFDYERLLLEAFPDLYTAKCITHSDTESFNQPGKVLLLVIPNIQNEYTQGMLEPRVSIGMLARIKQFLEVRISPFVTIEVINPVYQSVKVAVNVSYYSAYPDTEYYNNVLNQRLQAFFAPWLKKDTQVRFSTEIYLSSIVNFIEEQEFVDYITYFKVYYEGVEVIDSIKPNSEKVILTSVVQHQIENENLC